MEWMCYMECGGSQNKPLQPTSNRLYTGQPGDRICILLSKPNNVSVSIKTDNDDRVVSETDRRHHMYGSRDTESAYANNKIAGTHKSVLKYFNENGSVKNVHAFDEHIKITLRRGRTRLKKNELLKTPSFEFQVVDLSSVFVSELVRSIEDNDGPTQSKRSKLETTTGESKIFCVLQNHVKNARLICEPRPTLCSGCKRIRLKRQSWNDCHFCRLQTRHEKESQLWNDIGKMFPHEILLNIFRYMHYDQVSWLADKDELFARSLAYHRYRVTGAFDLKMYPDLRSVVQDLRKRNALEMRFNGSEELWICSLQSGCCRPFRVKEGTYTWLKAVSMTSLKLNCSRCICTTCASLLVNLQKCMNKNQSKIVTSTSRVKVFALNGSENVAIDTELSSTLWVDDTSPKDYDYLVHLWTDGLDDRWLQDIRTEDGLELTIGQYRTIESFKTLLFKDPVKFFGVKKTVRIVDEDVVVFTSDLDHEVLGYLVRDQNYRFRVPTNCPRTYVIGVNFLPDCVVAETVAAHELVKHIFSHDIDFTVSYLEQVVAQLESDIRLNPPHAEALTRELENVRIYISRLQILQGHGVSPQRVNVWRERYVDYLHVHETFTNDFEFCSRYLFEKLGQLDEKRAYKFVTSAVVHSCNINVINPDLLKALFTISAKSQSRRFVYY